LEIGANSEIEWETPARVSDPGKKRVVYLALAVPFVFGVSIRQPLLGVVGSGLLAMMTLPAFRPNRFKLTEQGAEAGSQTISWESVKRVELAGSAIFLSPFSKENPLEATRGVRLNVNVDNRNVVLAYVREKVAKEVGFLERGTERREDGGTSSEGSGPSSEAKDGSSSGDGA
jgi:hypothetical protein